MTALGAAASALTSAAGYSAGYFSIRDMAKVGVVMTVGAAACVTIAVVAVRAVVG